MTRTTAEELDRLAAQSQSAFHAALRASDAERAGWLRAVADALDDNAAELAGLADEETHLGLVRLTGEVVRTTGQLRLFAEVVTEGGYLEATIDHADPRAVPPRPELRRMLRPLGPVAVYSASNFPFAFSVAGGDTASALAAGCPVIVKAHSGHVRLSRRTAQLAIDALSASGAPDGMLGLVEGREAGIALIQHPAITAAGFTGSLAGGRALFDLASARTTPIPFYGELGSVNPVVVTAAADAARGSELATGLAASFTLGSGQFCTKPGVVFVPRGSTIEAELGDRSDLAAGLLLTPAIAAGFREGLERLRANPAVDEVTRGASADGDGAEPAVFAVDAAVLDSEADELLSEVFGPVTILVRYADGAELRRSLEHLDGSLTATLHAEDGEDVVDLADALAAKAGRLLFAGWPTGVAVTWSQHHGGPWPSTTSLHTSVGASSIRRFLRPIAFQDAPEALLPVALRDGNPRGIPRRVDGVLERS